MAAKTFKMTSEGKAELEKNSITLKPKAELI